MPRLLFAISAHGLGHLGQAAPVCNALVAQQPGLDLILWSALPLSTLRQRINVPFTHLPMACDIGFLMHDALNVDVAASWERYRQREDAWSERLREACDVVLAHQPGLIVSDVGEMPLAAGQALGIPTIAMSSLNWADLAHHYFADQPDSTRLLSRLDDVYAKATLAIRLSPGMPMHGQREIVMPPVGSVSNRSRTVIDHDLIPHLHFADKPRVLIGMGGIETPLSWMNWPQQSAFNLLVANQPTLPLNGDTTRGIVNADSLRQAYGWSFCDLLAASDAVLCKPGYGTFVEAALANVPVLYVKRNDWPEQPVLVDWLHRHARCAELPPSHLQSGDFEHALRSLWSQPSRPPLMRDGASQAAREILSLIRQSDRKTERLQ